MTNETVLQKIISRVEVLEEKVQSIEKNLKVPTPFIKKKQKALTLAEVIRGRNFNSGQEKIVVIVGYYEKILKKDPIREADLKEGWKVGKFDGKYSPNFLTRSATWVRNIDSNLDLSQTGERFFEDFLKLNNGKNQK